MQTEPGFTIRHARIPTARSLLLCSAAAITLHCAALPNMAQAQFVTLDEGGVNADANVSVGGNNDNDNDNDNDGGVNVDADVNIGGSEPATPSPAPAPAAPAVQAPGSG